MQGRFVNRQARNIAFEFWGQLVAAGPVCSPQGTHLATPFLFPNWPPPKQAVEQKGTRLAYWLKVFSFEL